MGLQTLRCCVSLVQRGLLNYTWSDRIIHNCLTACSGTSPNLYKAQEPQLARIQTLSTTGVGKHRPQEKSKLPGKKYSCAGQIGCKGAVDPISWMPAQCPSSCTKHRDCASWGDKDTHSLGQPKGESSGC